ncbi:HNH endonuclease [Shinella sp.]|uniref:HNH endonuclease n=1 Tax=Shinella sp. TaxID=1870904 RepID=UPI00289899B6|nr:HNH endonuclease [Shinella sp.]
MAELSYAQVSALLKYDSESGKLFWKERPIEMFTTESSHSPEMRCAMWNTRYAGKEALTASNDYGYLHGVVLYRSQRAHRIAWLLHYGVWPQGDVDHINGDPADNRIVNLREVSHAINRRNSKLSARNKSGVTGVRFHPKEKKWVAYIRTDTGQMHLGSFASMEEAVAIRKAAEVQNGYHPNHSR